MVRPLVSIIVPIYNVPEQYLNKCIESILKQTLKEIEILLVDDGSSDPCGKICDAYAAKDSRIRVIHKSNGGLSSARNAGFREAVGEWIMFVDGDDWIESDMCKVLLTVAIEKKVQLVMCGIYKDYGRKTEEYSFYLEDGMIYSANKCKWLQEQLLHFNGNIATAYSKLIKRKILVENNILHDEDLRQGAEGLEFNLRLFEKLERATFINKPLYHYIYNENSISASHDENNHELVIKCFEKINEFIKTSSNRNMLIPWFDNRLLYVIITTAISGYFNPSNKEPYVIKKQKYIAYLKKPLIKNALKTENLQGLSMSRKIVLLMIKLHLFFPLNLIGKIRKWQKTHQ